MRKVDVYLTGRVLPERDPEDCARRLAALAGIGADRARALLRGGRLVRIRRDCDAYLALEYRRTLAELGADVLLRPAAPAPPLPVVPPKRPKLVRLRPALPQSVPPVARTTAPRLSPAAARPRRAREWQADPRSVEATRGWDWWLEAGRMLRDRPGQWLGLVCASGALLGLLLLLPAPLLTLLGLSALPPLLGVYMAAAHNQRQDDALQLAAAFAAAGRRLLPLALLGLLAVLALLLAGAACFFAADYGLFAPGGPYERLRAMGWPLPLAALCAVLVAVPLAGGCLLAVPLTTLAGARPLRAWRLGVLAWLRNPGAGLIALGAGLPLFGLAAALVGLTRLLLPGLPLAPPALALLLTPLLLALGLALVYNAFQDMFAVDP